MGFSALNLNTSGSYDTGIGYLALSTNIAGSNSIGIGGNALRFNTATNNIVAIGHDAAWGNTVSYSNQGGTYIGYQSGANASTNSDYNTFLGYQSGFGVTTGNDNIILGVNPNTGGGNNLTTGANNILIGYNAIAPSGAAANNQLNIGNFLFGTGLTATSSSTSLPTALTGNLGLGTSTPSSTLFVQNNYGAGPAFTIASSTNSSGTTANTLLTVLNNGNVGIGTTSPLTSLDVGGQVTYVGPFSASNIPVASFSANSNAVSGVQFTNVNTGTVADFRFAIADQTGNYTALTMPSTGNAAATVFGLARSTATFLFNNGGTTRAFGIGTLGANDLVLGTNGTDRLHITSAGNVGIGTTSPYANLSVMAGGNYASLAPSTVFAIGSSTAGTATSTLFSINSSGLVTNNGSETIAGKLGINNTNPQYTLDVAGFINTDQYSGYKQAGNTILYASTTNSTLAVGASSAAVWMAASSTQWYDTAVGYGALATTPTTGTAQYNFAIGYQTLNSNTAGLGNTAIGMQSLLNNSTGSNNIAMGGATLGQNTTGSNNTAVGVSVLRYNTLAANSTGFGAYAGYGNALSYSNTGGTYIGFRTGYFASTNSDYNTFLGYQAGYDVTTGNDNIIIGANPNTSGSHLTTGMNNILIGYNAIAPEGAAANNDLNIGNIIFGTGLTATSSATTVPTALSGLIGIGHEHAVGESLSTEQLR